MTILLCNHHFEVISTHFFTKKTFVASCNQPYVELGLKHRINSLDRITVRVLIISVAFSTCSVVVVGETIGVNGVPTLLADST